MGHMEKFTLMLLIVQRAESFATKSPGRATGRDIEDEYMRNHQEEPELVQKAMTDLLLAASKYQNSEEMNMMDRTTCLDDTDQLCFEAVDGFLWYYRVPDTPDKVNTKFYLYTSPDDQTSQPQKMDPHSDLSKTLYGFNHTLPLKIIIHGWSESSESIWMEEMKNAMFDITENMCNVVLVDWRDGATQPDYLRSVANTRLVGKQVGMFVESLEAYFGTNIGSQTHIIGFSLGAHTAGYAGMHLMSGQGEGSQDKCQRLYRITGLDPAGPLFEDEPADLRLDPSDACYVDVIHTDAHPWTISGLGIIQTCGHVDFYPNGGYNQPGCGDQVGDLVCNHIRAVEYYLETISSGVSSLAFPCEDIDNYLHGNCFDSDTVEKFGNGWTENNSHNGGGHSLFLLTQSHESFMGEQLKIQIELSDGSDSASGKLLVKLVGMDGTKHKVTMASDMNLSPSQKVEEVIVVPLGFVADKVEITYTKSWYLFWTGNQWRVAYTIDVSDGEGNKKTARPTGNKLKTGEKQTLEFA